MAKKKAARPTAKKAKRPVKKSARKASKSASRPAARKATKAKKAPARKAAKPASKARKSAPTPARKAAKKARRKGARRRPPGKPLPRKPAAKASKPVRRAKVSKPAARKAAPAKKAPMKAPAARPVAAKKAAAPATPMPAVPRAARAGSPGLRRIANLDRPRRTVADIHGVPSSLDMDRTASSVRSGRLELEHQIHEQTNTSPALTAGDVDADWGGASAVRRRSPRRRQPDAGSGRGGRNRPGPGRGIRRRRGAAGRRGDCGPGSSPLGARPGVVGRLRRTLTPRPSDELKTIARRLNARRRLRLIPRSPTDAIPASASVTLPMTPPAKHLLGVELGRVDVDRIRCHLQRRHLAGGVALVARGHVAPEAVHTARWPPECDSIVGAATSAFLCRRVQIQLHVRVREHDRADVPAFHHHAARRRPGPAGVPPAPRCTAGSRATRGCGLVHFGRANARGHVGAVDRDSAFVLLKHRRVPPAPPRPPRRRGRRPV